MTQRNQLAAHIQVIDRASVMLGIDDRDDAASKLGQLANRLIQLLMHGNVKMVWAQKIADPFQGSVIKHQCAQKPLLRSEVMR